MSGDTTKPRFRAGDEVLHAPTGETWLLIVDEEDGVVVPGGWPDTRAQASDCSLVRAATDAERLEQLRGTSKSGHSAHDLASRQFAAHEHDDHIRGLGRQLLRDSRGAK